MANEITTQAPTNIGKFGFTFNGTLVSKDHIISERGYCWVKGAGTPVYDINTQKEVGADFAVETYAKNSTETTPMYGCVPGQTYSVRAFGKDSVTEEIFYGDSVTFSTLSSTFSGTITVEGATYTDPYLTLGIGKDLTTWAQVKNVVLYGVFETSLVILLYDSLIGTTIEILGTPPDVNIKLLCMRDHLLLSPFSITGGMIENATITDLENNVILNSGKLNRCTVWSNNYDFIATGSTSSLTNVTLVGSKQCEGVGSIAGLGLNKVTLQGVWNQGSLTGTPSPNDVANADAVTFDGFGLSGLWVTNATGTHPLSFGMNPVHDYGTITWNATTKIFTLPAALGSREIDCNTSGVKFLDFETFQIYFYCDTTLVPAADNNDVKYYILMAPAGPTGYGRENGTAGALISATETPAPPVSSGGSGALKNKIFQRGL